MATETTRVQLLNVPLHNDYQHTFYFSSKSMQQIYLNTNFKVKEYANCSYQRKDKLIRVPALMDDIINCNYVAYRNSDSGKWYYAFITRMEYQGSENTYVYIETDVIQTYMFDYQVGMSFVEREHVNDDTIGKHTIPENVQLGDYIVNATYKDSNLKPSNYVVMGSSVKRVASDSAYNSFDSDIGAIYNGVYSGVKYYKHLRYSDNEDEETISDVIQSMADDEKAEAISSLFLAPEFLIPDTNSDHSIEESTTCKSYELNPTIDLDTLDGYEPINKKLLTNPYRYLLVTNGTGGTAEYYHEYFTDGPEFKVIGSLTPGCSIRLIPLNYKGVGTNHMEGLNLGKFPQCNWATDQYTNWLTQNGVNFVPNVVAASVGGAMMGGVPGAVMGGLGAVSHALIESFKASRIPPQTAGNINCGDVITSANENTFTFYSMSIKKEYAKIIDNYFNMYGYQVNELKVPNSNHRANYWFTKTIDANITGPIPKDDLTKIINAYNNGITFWKPSNFRNYSVDNSIV